MVHGIEIDPLPHGAPSDYAELDASISGRVLTAADPEYDRGRRVWNGAIDRRPAAIVRCAHAGDVAAAIRFASRRRILTAIRGGGHNVAGTAVCDGGIVIDLSTMRRVDVDAAGRRATAQAGVLWGEIDQASQASGLATTGGIVSHTGIAGLTLGGGIGWLMREHGLTVDNLLSVEMVTADGDLCTASERENPDLFWGLRGGGGNYGVVTSFEYRLHTVGPTVLAGPIFFALEDAPAMVRFYRDWIAAAPDELCTVLNFRRAPAAPFLPTAMHGLPVVAVVAMFAGRIDQGVEVLKPLRAFGRPIIDLIEPKPYLSHQSMFDPLVPHGWHYYWKSCDTAGLTDDLIDTLVRHTEAITSPRSYTLVFHVGGAVARVDEEATAYHNRAAQHILNINAAWVADDPDPAVHIDWANGFYADVEPSATGVYINFLGEEGDARVRAAYGGPTIERLRKLKTSYDPGNLFRLNQNIEPMAAADGGR